MDLIPGDDQQEIIGMASGYLAREFPLSRFHKPFDEARRQADQQAFAEMGWLSIALPESAGGAGFGVVEEALIFREIGRVIGPTAPLPALLAAKLAHCSSLTELRDDIVSGRQGVGLAIAETPLRVGPGGVSGRVRIYGAAEAGGVLVEAEEEVFLLEGAHSSAVSCAWLDSGIDVATAELDGLRIILRAPAGPTWANGALLTAAMLVGMAEGAIAMITDYAKVRETFGRKIGAYQAVRHPIAEGAARCEHAKALLFFAALALRDERADAQLQVRSAKLVAHRAATRNADINIQLHGGIGITEELPAHHFMKRALSLAPWFGSRKVNLDAILHAPLLTI